MPTLPLILAAFRYFRENIQLCLSFYLCPNSPDIFLSKKWKIPISNFPLQLPHRALFTALYFQMCPQIACLGGCEVALVAFVTFHHCVFSYVSAKHLHKRKQNCIDCICSPFLHCAFSNVSSKRLHKRIQSHTGSINQSYISRGPPFIMGILYTGVIIFLLLGSFSLLSLLSLWFSGCALAHREPKSLRNLFPGAHFSVHLLAKLAEQWLKT